MERDTSPLLVAEHHNNVSGRPPTQDQFSFYEEMYPWTLSEWSEEIDLEVEGSKYSGTYIAVKNKLKLMANRSP